MRISLSMYSALLIIAAALAVSTVAAGEAAKPATSISELHPGLASGALLAAKVTALPEGVLVRSDGMTITQKDIDAEIAKAPENVREQLKSNAFFLAENLAASKLLVAEAKVWAKKTDRKSDETDQETIRTYLQNLTDKLSVTDAEIKAFFEQNKDMMGTATFDQVKDQIKEFVLDQKRQDAVEAHIKSIGTRITVEVDRDWAARQFASAMNNPVDKARKSSKPSLVDFGASGCGPCDMMAPILESLKKEYEGKVNVVFIDVRKEQILGARYGIQSIPVQIFYDEDGIEVFRHTGFFAKDKIVAKLEELGVK